MPIMPLRAMDEVMKWMPCSDRGSEHMLAMCFASYSSHAYLRYPPTPEGHQLHRARAGSNIRADGLAYNEMHKFVAIYEFTGRTRIEQL